MSKPDSTKRKPLTKRAFERLLRKAAQPLPKEKSSPKERGTEEPRPSDGYSGRCKSQDKTGDEEG